jgi:hypothetical protein
MVLVFLYKGLKVDVREKNQIIYKGKLIKIIADFSKKTLKARKA